HRPPPAAGRTSAPTAALGGPLLETKNNTPSREDEEICNSTRERIEEEEEKINDLSIDSDSTAQPPARKRKTRHNQPEQPIPQFLAIFSTIIHNNNSFSIIDFNIRTGRILLAWAGGVIAGPAWVVPPRRRSPAA